MDINSSVGISTFLWHFPAYSSVIPEQFVVVNCQSYGSCNNLFEEPVRTVSLTVREQQF